MSTPVPIRILIAAFMICRVSFAQMPSTDIWLMNISFDDNNAELSSPENMTSRKGYDNQPFFSLDGKVYYTSEVNGQTDIFSFDLSRSETRMETFTPTSEYSPTMIGKDLHVVMVEKDSSQTIWKNPGKRKGKRITKLKNEKIGYYVFTGKDSLAVFILGEPHKLKILDLKTNQTTTITDSIGRGLKSIPGTNTFSYSRISKGTTSLYRFNKSSGKGEFIAALPAEDYEWLDASTILSSDSRSFKLFKIGSGNWQHVQLTERLALSGITRIAYSPVLKKIAVTVSETH